MLVNMWMGIVTTIIPKYSLCLENIENINEKRKWILFTKSACISSYMRYYFAILLPLESLATALLLRHSKSWARSQD